MSPVTMEPRITAALPAYPKDTSLIPDSGWIAGLICFSFASSSYISMRGGSSKWTMTGREGPNTSQSKMPTFAPLFRSSKARLTATVLLPTPPLHEDTAMMLFTLSNDGGTCGIGLGGLLPCAGGDGRCGGGGGRLAATTWMSTRCTHGSEATAARARSSKKATSRSKATRPASRSAFTSETKPQATMSAPRPGSLTVRSCLRTSRSLSEMPLPSPGGVLSASAAQRCTLEAV
mmetsp:Transcript_19753/g.54382  ORF Transcript_19753/g.54382 Transcript_19753/m.54382 type:complete len:233 (-) Transcript_19753:285-983(-)